MSEFVSEKDIFYATISFLTPLEKQTLMALTSIVRDTEAKSSYGIDIEAITLEAYSQIPGSQEIHEKAIWIMETFLDNEVNSRTH